MSFYLACEDVTPTVQSRDLHTSKIETAKKRAFSLLADAVEGQIGIWERNYDGGQFFGYAIKHAGEEPYFEEPEKAEQS